MLPPPSSMNAAAAAAPPALLIPPLAVDHLALVEKLETVQFLFFHAIYHAYWKRTKVFPELDMFFRKKANEYQCKVKNPTEDIAEWEYLMRPEECIAWNGCFLQWFSLTIRYSLYEASHVLLSAMMNTIFHKWEIHVGVLYLFFTNSCYLATGMMGVLRRKKPGIQDLILNLLLQKHSLHNVRFAELQTWFASLFNFFSEDEQQFGPFASVREMICLKPAIREKKIRLIFEIGNHLLTTRNVTMHRCSHEEESIVLTWIMELMFMYLHKDLLARQIYWCHHFFGNMSMAMENHQMYLQTFLFLLEQVQSKIYGSFQLVLPEHGSIPHLPSIETWQRQKQRQVHQQNQEILETAPGELSIVLQLLTRPPSSSSFARSVENTADVSAASRLNVVLMFGKSSEELLNETSSNNSWIDSIVDEVSKTASVQYWFRSSKKDWFTDCRSMFRLDKKTQLTDMYNGTASTCHSSTNNESVYPEMHIFTSNSDTHKKGQVNVNMDCSAPFLRYNRILTSSPFEISYLSGTFVENGLTHTLDILVQKHKRDVTSTVSLLQDLFHRVYVPMKWAKHATVRLLQHLTNNKTWWYSVQTSKEEMDSLVNVWIQWFRACEYNLNSLNSRKLTDLQLLIISSTYLQSDQKKKMIESMITSMEFQELYLFETVELYDFKHLLTLLLTSIAHNEVEMIRMFFALCVERFVQLVTLKLYDWMDMYTQLDDDEATMSSTSKCMDAPPIFDSFPLYSGFANKCISLMDVPDWQEPGFTTNVTEDEKRQQDYHEKVTIIRQRKLSRCFTSLSNQHKEEEREGSRLQEIAASSKARVKSMIRKYKSSTETQTSNNTEETYEAETMMYRFMVGMANSSFMRAILELSKTCAQAGISYFWKWQPALLNFMHPKQTCWFFNRCEKLKSDSILHIDMYRLLLQRFRIMWIENPRHSMMHTMVSKCKSMLRCKLRNAQLRALSEFLNMFPSVMELRQITDLGKFQSFFPQRTLFLDSEKPTCDCNICFETIDCRKSLAVFTNCGHFFCLSCSLRAFFRWQGSIEDLENEEEEYEEDITSMNHAAVASSTTPQAITWVCGKPKEQCVCPFCRMSVNSPQPSLPGCFNNFLLIESLHSISSSWSLTREQARKCVLPVLYLLDFAANTSLEGYGVVNHRKRKITT